MSSPPQQDSTHPYNTTSSLISHLIPLVLFASQSLHMRYALRSWWSLSKLGHVLLRIFFPESIIWFVGREEWERRWVVRDIGRRLAEEGQSGEDWDEGSTLQKLMSIQGGRVYFRFDDENAMQGELSKEVGGRSPDDELPAMPEAPSRRPSQQQQYIHQPQPHAPRNYHSPYGSPQEGLSSYTTPHRPSAGVSPISGPRPAPPYPISEYNLSLNDPPQVPPIPPNHVPHPSARSVDQQPRHLLRPPLHRSPISAESQATTILLNPAALSHS
ncbi:hypothetical protein BDZ91DRAFT_847382, partial [Kalaharituber pfeilii]